LKKISFQSPHTIGSYDVRKKAQQFDNAIYLKNSKNPSSIKSIIKGEMRVSVLRVNSSTASYDFDYIIQATDFQR